MAIYRVETPTGGIHIEGYSRMVAWIRKPLSEGKTVNIRLISTKHKM